MLNQQSYVEAFIFNLLVPGIRLLKEDHVDRDLIDIIFHNLFRQMEMWRYDFSSLPRWSFIYDPGVPKEEAQEVYNVLDGVFAEVFPAQANLGREITSLWMEDLIRLARTEVVCPRVSKGPSLIQLLHFMEKLLEAMEQLTQKLVTLEVKV